MAAKGTTGIKARVVLCLVGIGVTIGVSFIFFKDDTRPRQAVAGKAQARAESARVSQPSSYCASGLCPDATNLAQVRKLVADRNRREAKQREHFEAEGWQMVAAPAPEPEIVELRPEAVPAREAEIQTQLQSAPVPSDALERVAEIVRRATQEKTRFVAIEALGRSFDEKAQRLLTELFDQSPANRGQVLGLLQPKHFDDETAEFLVRQLARDDLEDELKSQAASQLVALGLAQPQGIPEDFLARLSPSWRERLRELYVKGRG